MERSARPCILIGRHPHLRWRVERFAAREDEMVEASNPRHDHPPVEDLFLQYMATSSQTVEKRLAQQICCDLSRRIAARKADLAREGMRGSVRSPDLRASQDVLRQGVYAL